MLRFLREAVGLVLVSFAGKVDMQGGHVGPNVGGTVLQPMQKHRQVRIMLVCMMGSIVCLSCDG